MAWLTFLLFAALAQDPEHEATLEVPAADLAHETHEPPAAEPAAETPQVEEVTPSEPQELPDIIEPAEGYLVPDVPVQEDVPGGDPSAHADNPTAQPPQQGTPHPAAASDIPTQPDAQAPSAHAAPPVVASPLHTPAAPAPAAPATTPAPEPDYLPFPFDFGWSSPSAPDSAPPPTPTNRPAPIAASPWLAYLLPLPERGFQTVIRLLLWLVVCAIATRQLDRLRARLLPTGILPTAAALSSQALRLVAILLGLLLLAAVLPKALMPIVPLAMLGGAVAVGMSVWTILPDLWAGVLLTVEQRITPGQWLEAGDVCGEVLQVGLRSTTLTDRAGRTITVPNHVLVALPIASDDTHWPPVDIAIPVPEDMTTEQVRELLTEAVLLSPFLAPKEEPVLVQSQFHPPVWRVRARIVEAHWADEFEGALRERIRELLERR